MEKPVEPKSLAQEEADFFNQSVPSDAEKAKLTKDSIMALYGSQAVTAAPIAAPGGTNTGAPTSNLSLLTGLGGPATGGFPGQFQNNNNHNNGGIGAGGFPTQQSHQQVPHPMVANNGLNHHFGGLSLGGPVNQQPQFGQQMQSLNGGGGGGGGFNNQQLQFNGNGGLMGQQQHPQGMNFFPAATTGMANNNGFPMMGGGGGGVKGGFTTNSNNLMGQQPPQMMMGSNGGGQFSYGMPGAGPMMPNGVVGNGAQHQQQQKQQTQFGNLNLGNVWQ